MHYSVEERKTVIWTEYIRPVKIIDPENRGNGARQEHGPLWVELIKLIVWA